MKGGNIHKALGGLENMLKNMKEIVRQKYVVEVGIFGAKDGRSKSGMLAKKGGHKIIKGSNSSLTNAELGLIHEMGSISNKIPPRSFLKMPIQIKKDELVAATANDLKTMFMKGKVMMYLKRIGIAAENIVQEAFASGGFGKWAPLKPATAHRKNSAAILIDTAQLRRSIDSRVAE